MSDKATDKLVKLSTFAVRSRTTVERDGYTGELQVIPQVEGPARLVKEMRRLYGGMLAIGVADETCWEVLSRIALDCAPAMRVPFMRLLLKDKYLNQWTRTAAIADAVGMFTKTAGRVLDDLAMLGIVEHRKQSEADNSPHEWRASNWLHAHFPPKVRTEIYY